MIGQIFQSRYRVEAALAEGRAWQSWMVRDIINNRPSLLFTYPADPEGRMLDRRSVAWRLSRYREVLGERIPQIRLGIEGANLTLLCEIPAEAKALSSDEERPAQFDKTLSQDSKTCKQDGIAPPRPDRRMIWCDSAGAPFYLPPALLVDPVRGETLTEPLVLDAELSYQPPKPPAEIVPQLFEIMDRWKSGESSVLTLHCGRPGGLSLWRDSLDAWFRNPAGTERMDAAPPLHLLENFNRPSSLLNSCWAPQDTAAGPCLLILDGDSLNQNPVLRDRVEDQLSDMESLHAMSADISDYAHEYPETLPESIDDEGRSFLELLSLMDEAVHLDFLLDLLQVDEADFNSMLNTLERAGTLASVFGRLEDGRRGLRVCISNTTLRQSIRAGIEADRERELHLLILGLLERSKPEGLVAAFCRLGHRRGVGRDEHLMRDGMKLFESLREAKLDLAAQSVVDILLDGDHADLSAMALREFALYRGSLRLRRDDLPGAERAYLEGLASLTGQRDFIEQLRGGQRPPLSRRVDAELLSSISALIRALAEIGEIRGEFARAGEILEGLLDAYSESLAARERGTLYNELAWILYRRGDHTEAVERCETALRLFDAGEHPAELGQTFNTLGAAQWALGNWREAEAYYQKALTLREKTGNETRIAASLNNLGNLYRMLERLPLAIEYFQRSMDIKRRQGNEAGYLVSLYNVALSSFEMNDLKTARRQGEDCLELNEKVGNIQLGAELLGLLGEIDLVDGRYASAAERLVEAIRICSDIDARTELASMYRRLAGVHLALGDLDAATETIKDGLAEACRVGSRFEEAQILVYKGECQERSEDAEGAVKALEAAADILSVLDKMEWLARVYSRLGLIHLDSGREERAQELLQQASGLIERRRITVPMQEWDSLQARIQSRRDRLIDSLGEQDSRGRLAGFMQLLETLEKGGDQASRAGQVLDQMAVVLPLSRGAIFLNNEKTSLADMESKAVFHGDFPDAGMLAEASRNRMKSAAPYHENGRIYLPLLQGEQVRGLLFLESEENLDEQTRDYLSTLGKLLAMGLFDPPAAEPAEPASRAKRTPKPQSAKDQVNLIGRGRDLQRVLKLVGQVKDLDSTVLISGESGTGKEEVARAVHYWGRRGRRPFMAVNCAALPETLLESQLFGHERGSFTGATHRHTGFFESASGGTIFLDEIGEMSPGMQSKLLRVLQEKQFIRVGGTRTLSTDARVIAATNRRLADEVQQGRFREDLFFRINVISVNIAPLRERREDIPLLMEHFLERIAEEAGLPLKRVSEEVMQIFLTHPLPGNVRQIRNVLENCMILARSGLIGIEDLPEDFLQQAKPRSLSRSLDELAEMIANSNEFSEQEPLEGKLLTSVAKHLVRRTGSKVKAAKLLGISRPTLYSRLRTAEDGKNNEGPTLKG
jgi:DNA-binding NtrC family response regulator/tetratricopeptide (TPR) repeat protein